MAAVVVHQEVTAAVLVTLVAPQTPVILSQVSVMDTNKHFIILFYLAIILGVQSNSVSKAGSELFSSDSSLWVKKSKFQMHYL